MERNRWEHLFKVYRKPLLLAALAIGVTMTLLVSVFTWGAYRLLILPQMAVTSTVDEKGSSTNGLTKNEAKIHNIVLTVAGEALAQSLKTEDVKVFMDGLACVDAIGGPSPETVINHLKFGISDSSLVSQLEIIEKNLSGQIKNSGPASCVDWILRG